MTEPTFIDPPASRSVDSLPVRATASNLLDYDRVAQHIARASESGRYSGPTDPQAYLLHKQCLVDVGNEVYATMAGLLCFGQTPQALFPRAVVDIGQYRGLEAITYESTDLVTMGDRILALSVRLRRARSGIGVHGLAPRRRCRR